MDFKTMLSHPLKLKKCKRNNFHSYKAVQMWMSLDYAAVIQNDLEWIYGRDCLHYLWIQSIDNIHEYTEYA